MMLLRLVLALSILGSVGSLAYADSYTITGSVDISGGYTGDTFGPIDPSEVTLAVGDVVNLTYTFADHHRLRLSDDVDGKHSFGRVTGWLAVKFPGFGHFTIADWTLDLIDARSGSGNARTSFSGAADGSCCAHLGSSANSFLADGDFLEFSGVTTTFTITSLPANPNTYDNVRTRFDADAISVIRPNAIDIDINPGKDLRCLNESRVVILGDADFDVTNIDINSLKFGDGGENLRAPLCNTEYVDDDAYLDMICKFVPGTGQTTLTGQLLNKSLFGGSDTICATQ